MNTHAAATAVSVEKFEAVRSMFPVLGTIAYLNAGTFGPIARSTHEAMQREVESDLCAGRSGLPYFKRVLGLREEVRVRLAALVGADLPQVALTASTTDGCNIVLAGLGLGSSDEIITTTDEHFGLLGPLAASGAHVVVVQPDPEAIVAAVTPATRLIAVSQVLWTTGRVLPVREIREAAGIPILVDGAQSVGAIDVAAAGLDFLTISGQKWLCGPDSTGGLVISDPDRLRIATPSSFSQKSHEQDGRFEPHAGAARFESNWWSAASLTGILAAIDVRPSWAEAHGVAVAATCRERLAARVEVVEPESRSTLVSFRPPGDPTTLVAELHAAGVHVREIPATGLIRASCGYWTSDGDIDRLVAGLPA